jgi:hypothetical protein
LKREIKRDILFKEDKHIKTGTKERISIKSEIKKYLESRTLNKFIPKKLKKMKRYSRKDLTEKFS